MCADHDATHSARASIADAAPLRILAAECRLEAWTATSWTHGLQIDRQLPFDTFTVCTHNSTYTMVVLRPNSGEVLLRGGSHCPTFERALLVGATAGGSFIKMRGIYHGLRMEIVIRGRHVVTSPVVSLAGCARCSAADVQATLLEHAELSAS